MTTAGLVMSLAGVLALLARSSPSYVRHRSQAAVRRRRAHGDRGPALARPAAAGAADMSDAAAPTAPRPARRWVFVSDVHLGTVGGRRDTGPALAQFLEGLATRRDPASRVVLLGDVLEMLESSGRAKRPRSSAWTPSSRPTRRCSARSDGASGAGSSSRWSPATTTSTSCDLRWGNASAGTSASPRPTIECGPGRGSMSSPACCTPNTATSTTI